jgi:hypothetical protein
VPFTGVPVQVRLAVPKKTEQSGCLKLSVGIELDMQRLHNQSKWQFKLGQVVFACAISEPA